jgi:hypothetical protein
MHRKQMWREQRSVTFTQPMRRISHQRLRPFSRDTRHSALHPARAFELRNVRQKTTYHRSDSSPNWYHDVILQAIPFTRALGTKIVACEEGTGHARATFALLLLVKPSVVSAHECPRPPNDPAMKHLLPRGKDGSALWLKHNVIRIADGRPMKRPQAVTPFTGLRSVDNGTAA